MGESMVLLDALEDGPATLGSSFALRIAGAESNFAIALARLGVGARWISRLGRDHFGDLVLETLEAEGLDVGLVARDADAQTAAFFKWRSGGRTSVSYLRRGSAASKLSLEDVPQRALEGIELVHLTGITMALSESARTMVVEVARRAHDRGLIVVFDPNYRPPLWTSAEAAGRACRELFPFVDWLLCGREEGAAIFGIDEAEDLVEALTQDGVGAVVRVGDRGAMLSGPHGPTTVVPRRLEPVADEVGAGDGFAAGFSYGLLAGWDPVRCATAGNLIAACALRGTGDWETFPFLAEVQEELECYKGGVEP
ncbi:MAG TPA: sugar kinase [Actinomycetota bacterium]|nr:sugar kinase [Actinomycetota bacterium]